MRFPELSNGILSFFYSKDEAKHILPSFYPPFIPKLIFASFRIPHSAFQIPHFPFPIPKSHSPFPIPAGA
jgi:hypothetical protein